MDIDPFLTALTGYFREHGRIILTKSRGSHVEHIGYIYLGGDPLRVRFWSFPYRHGTSNTWDPMNPKFHPRQILRRVRWHRFWRWWRQWW